MSKAVIERSIHTLHPYPCKFPRSAIAPYLERDGDVILDPFCGSGTTLYEAAVNGWPNVIGFDSNPIATLITRVKLMPAGSTFFAAADSALADLTISGLSGVRPEILDFDGSTHWFDPIALTELSYIVAWINAQQSASIRDWLNISLSRIINRVSRQESETRYVAVDKGTIAGETLRRFAESCAATIGLLKGREPFAAGVNVACADACTHLPLDDDSVDRIITSPPYANSMDYYLYHKQRMNVLGYDFKSVQRMEIGSRHEYSSQKASAEKWERDYAAVLVEFQRVLRVGGTAIVIIGDSQIAGEKIDASLLTANIAQTRGLGAELIESTALDGRSRSFSRGFQRPNKFEHVIRLVKHHDGQVPRGPLLSLPPLTSSTNRVAVASLSRHSEQK
jgi:site-specific DNA-methyltransferase (cytosine-N4-specific)